MSRSDRAWTKSRALARVAVRGADKPVQPAVHARVGCGRLLGPVPLIRIFQLAVAAQLVLGLLPPTSLALQRGAAHGTLSAAQQSPPAGSAVPARASLLTLGSGYGSPHGSGS